MLEHYFIRPTTVDRIRAAWLGEPIEQYVSWLHEYLSDVNYLGWSATIILAD